MKFRPRRNPTDYEVTLQSEFGVFHVEVLDISLEGARIRVTDGLLFPDTELCLDTPKGQIPATVIWSAGREAGIEFRRPLDQVTFSMIARKVQSASAANKTRKKPRFLPH